MERDGGNSRANGQAGNGSVEAPQVALPKGGGAIRGIGEKFAANPVTGTGSMSIPFAVSPGRNGFGPQLSLSYDSGAGNGPFGFGWSLSLPSITRKTDKGLPQYRDAEESDVFLLSGAEDLVPVVDEPPHAPGYTIRRYRPRIEGLFARIERWTRDEDPEDVHWRSISKDNILTLYGSDANSRIYDPLQPDRVFSWLICETRDDKGNAILYEYKAENGGGVDLLCAHERNRGDADDPRRHVNRYLKRVLFGNRTPLLDRSRSARATTDIQWLFEVVLDYGEHDEELPTPIDRGREWDFRADPFSSYRAGFEVRTTRLCQRVLMFHHIPDEDGQAGYDGLVRSTDLSYEHELAPGGAPSPNYTVLRAVSQVAYKREGSGYRKRALPPVEFTYSPVVVQDAVHDVDPASLENLPIGLDGSAYRWTDLHGEGIPGILTEQAGAWFYKPNLTPVRETSVDLASAQRVSLQPSFALAGGQADFMDLAGDGQPDLVALDEPLPGLFEHDGGTGWQPFRPLTSRLNRDLRDPNLKFIDLDGDGHADILITEDNAFVWHPSLAEAGFGPARRVPQARDEEEGPRLVFADGTQSIYLADLSGDGLTDIVRIRNGEVCYWPNLGYGRFGAKVTMDGAPVFDHRDQFDHSRIRLADIDGTGTTDIIYLHRDGVRLYFNQSGNSWSAARVLSVFPRIDDLVSIAPVDLFGNGTACLVWSSPLPGDGRRQMRYVDLMGGQKPHLLIRTKNNLGAETEVTYAASTRFYLADKLAGRPWITRLPFPVHVVERVTVTDKWRGTKFTTSYSYHHGYFDGVEREFRGFGRVDQLDTETYGQFGQGNTASPYITGDTTLYQPPVKTVTWYHTGALLDRERILSQYQREYFPNWFEDLIPGPTNVLGDFRENVLPEPDFAPGALTYDERRQAMRACKGMMLRQEVYELDVDALENGEERPVKLFSAAYHNCHIRRLQEQAGNRHAVFLVTESEAITYHYELDLRADSLTPDPRVAHTLNLQVDEFGNVLQSVAVVYPRLGRHVDATLEDTQDLIADVQREMHLAYSETRYTTDVDEPNDYRLRVPCEVLTYELTGIGPQDDDDLQTPDVRDDRYFTLDELRRFRLSFVHQTGGETVEEIAYHVLPNGTAQKRLVEHVRMLFFANDLQGPLPFEQLGRLGLPYETYKLALTEALLAAVFGDKIDAEVRGELSNARASGYLSGADLAARFPRTDTAGQYWIRSGIAGFAAEAAEHFYLPERSTDPFSNTTTVGYDAFDLVVRSSTDPLGNTQRVVRFDYRVLAPQSMADINGNVSSVAFDVLGLPCAVAAQGKGESGDTVDRLDLDPPAADLAQFFTTNVYDEAQAGDWLGSATGRHVYYLGETVTVRPDGTREIIWGTHPPCACGIVRERHVAQVAEGGQSPLQVAFEYSDGGGNVLVKKVQAEPGRVPSRDADGRIIVGADGQPEMTREDVSPRWIASGKTILNIKGKPVKQYEPYFIDRHTFQDPDEVGVTPVLYYDAVGRTVRTELPDGSFSRVEFSPWHVTSFDPNDTVLEPGNAWYEGRNAPALERPLPRDPTGQLLVTPDQRAAWLTALHQDTPAQVFLDSLGREVISVAHNRVEDATGSVVHGGLRYKDDKYVTFTKLDAEGKPLWIRDARGNRVMAYIIVDPPIAANDPDPTGGFVPCYDIAGNLLSQSSMDAGARWMLSDAAGQPFYAWDANESAADDGTLALQQRRYHTTYDALRRPREQHLSIDGAQSQIIERFEYGEPPPDDEAAREAPLRAAQERNLLGQVREHYDASGLVTNEAFDFKGNLLEVSRRLVRDRVSEIIDWSREQELDETYLKVTEYDALNRMTRLYNWHRGEQARVAVYEPRYNARGLLEAEDLIVGATRTGNGYEATSDSRRVTAVSGIAYDAKGQRTRLHHGNGTETLYDYDRETFRLRQILTTRLASERDFPRFRSNLQDGRVVQQLLYTYDPAGNITEVEDQAYEPVFFRNQIAEPRSLYTYDPLYRLIEATGRENATAGGPPPQRPGDAPEVDYRTPPSDRALRRYTQRYVYDKVGNFLEMRHSANGGSWTRHYDPAPDSNRLTRTRVGDELVDYDYDTHGSMLNLNRTPDEFRLRWDHRDMIRHVNLGGGGQAWYQYDAGKQRTRKVIESRVGTEERLYLGGMEIYRKRNPDGDVLEEIESHHLFVDDQRVFLVDDVIRTEDRRGPAILSRYQYGNHLGSVALELDASAEIISYEEYHPYGTTAYQARGADVRATAKRYRYTGMERDEETGLSYHTARYYLPWLGRWGSTDPIGLVGGPNTYLYSSASPILMIDQNGAQDDSVTSLGSIARYRDQGRAIREAGIRLRV